MSTTTLERSQTFSRSNMSKLERLNARVSKLLTVAVHEVLEVVRDTVSEYQEKTARTQRENERLRLRLRDALEQLDKEREVSRLASVSLSVNSLSTPPERTPGSDVNCLRLESIPAQTEEPAIKGEELANAAEAETVCDLRVALTLADMCASETEHDNDTEQGAQPLGPSPTHCNPSIAVEDIKIESVAVEQSSPQQPMSQVGFDDIAEDRSNPATGRELIGTSSYGIVFVQSDLRCPVPGRSSKSATERARALQGPRGEENHGCKVCGKTFSRVGNLRIHERCHTGEKPYCCQVCGRCFIQAGDLKKHKRVHTGEKPYYCLQCGKSFSRRENLKRHQKIHIGESLHHQRFWKDPQ